MDTIIEGKVYVLGDDVDTDQIIPAKFLMYNPAVPEERELFGRYALSGVPEASAGLPQGNVPFTVDDAQASEYSIVIGGRNFGCGSSREHAPLALAEAGVNAVVAEFYARIFFRNSVNGGYLVPLESEERLVDQFATGQTARIDLAAGTITNLTTGAQFKLKTLGDVQPIIEAGGVFEYAKQRGMLA